MKQYVLDANALIRFLCNGEGASKIANLLVQAEKEAAFLSISTVNLAEVLYVGARTSSLGKTRDAVCKLQALVVAVAPDFEDALAAAEIRLQYKLGLADSFAAELALRRNATLVTADPEFARLGKRLKVLALPRHSR